MVGGPATISSISWNMAFRQEDDMHLPPNERPGVDVGIAPGLTIEGPAPHQSTEPSPSLIFPLLCWDNN